MNVIYLTFLMTLSSLARGELLKSQILTGVDNSLRFNPQLLNRPYYRYNAQALIEMGSTNSSATYRVCFYPDPSLSSEKTQSYIGWVQGYITSEGTQTQGYPNSDSKSQPIFIATEERSLGKITTLQFSPEIPQAFKDFIVSVCDQFSPPFDGTEKVSTQEVQAVALVDEANDRRRLVELQRLKENVRVFSRAKVDDSVIANGKFAETFDLDQNSFVTNYRSAYTFSIRAAELDSQQDPQIQFQFENGAQQLAPVVNIQLKLIEKVIPKPSFLDKVRKTLNLDKTVKVFQKDSLIDEIQKTFRVQTELKADRISKLPDLRELEFRQEPLESIKSRFKDKISDEGILASSTIDLSNTLSLGKIKDISPLNLRNFRNLQGFTTSLLLKPQFSTLLNISRLRIAKFIDLPPKTVPLYTQQKSLISQKVLGKPLSVSLRVACSMIVYNNSSTDQRNTINCSSDLLINMAGKVNKVHLFDFQKLAKNWSASKNFGGRWGVSFVIPLPPPVSFIQIAIGFDIGYTVGMGVYIQITGAKLQAGTYITTGLTASAEAGIRILIAQGGAYLSGTLVSLKTQPNLTLELKPNALVGSVNWQLTLNAFSFRWGLYYKWCYFIGCGSRKSITSWKVNQGLTKAWTIYSYTFSKNI